MYQNKKMALLHFCIFFFILVQIFTVFMNRKCLKKVHAEEMSANLLSALFLFLSLQDMLWGFFFLKRAESHECCPQVQFPGWKSAYGNVIFFSRKDFYGICKWNKTSPWWYWQDAEKEADCVLTCLQLRSLSPNPAALWGSAAWWSWLLILSVTLCKMLFH